MERHRTFLASTILVVAVLAMLALSGCGGGGDSIVGTWADDMGMEFEFKSGGNMVISYMGQQFETQYSAKDGTLSITGAEGAGLPGQIDYKVDGDKLTLTSPEGEKQTLTRK